METVETTILKNLIHNEEYSRKVLPFINKELKSVLQSIDKKFIIYLLILLILVTSKSFAINISTLNTKAGVIALMYHRFNENKTPSTNIKNDVFLKHLDEIDKNQLEIITFKKFKEIIKGNINKNYVMLTIDDAFTSFYLNAWPYLKKEKIPFILFVSTEPVGKFGYMSWKQIKEVNESKLSYIGNHSHTHEYLVNFSQKEFEDDINKSIKIFKQEIGSNPKIF